jgi:hypothetical protein
MDTVITRWGGLEAAGSLAPTELTEWWHQSLLRRTRTLRGEADL